MFSKVVPQEGKLDEYLTVGEAAEFLGVSPATLRNWDRAGKLVPYRHPLNKYRLYKKSDLEKLLNDVKKTNNSYKAS
jgi:MerR family copper efflux transcriptional regulator